MKSNKVEIHLKTFEDIQTIQEKYDIPFASSMSQVIVELINLLGSRDVPKVYLSINNELIPEGYKYNVCLWARHLKSRVNYPNFRSYRIRGEHHITFYAGVEDFQPNFYKRLKFALTENDIVSYPIDKVPLAYQRNPYTLTHRLRCLGIETKTTLTKTKLTIHRTN